MPLRRLSSGTRSERRALQRSPCASETFAAEKSPFASPGARPCDRALSRSASFDQPGIKIAFTRAASLSHSAAEVAREKHSRPAPSGHGRADPHHPGLAGGARRTESRAQGRENHAATLKGTGTLHRNDLRRHSKPRPLQAAFPRAARGNSPSSARNTAWLTQPASARETLKGFVMSATASQNPMRRGFGVSVTVRPCTRPRAVLR